MNEAVIVSTARTPIGKAYRGAFNNTHGAVMAAHCISHAVERAGIDPAEVEDVILGCGYPEGATGKNVARLAAYRAGLPVTTSGTTVNRFCSSGLQAIAMAAQRVVMDRVPVMVAGGVESVSLVQPHLNRHCFVEDWLMAHKPELWMSMIETADTVAKRCTVSREAQDGSGLHSQQRAAIARTLAMQPKVILFDEPTSALDPEMVQEVLNVIRALAEEGRTMLLVTHEMNFARQVSSEVVFLHQGLVEEQGSPEQVFTNPNSARCKQFMSSNH